MSQNVQGVLRRGRSVRTRYRAARRELEESLHQLLPSDVDTDGSDSSVDGPCEVHGRARSLLDLEGSRSESMDGGQGGMSPGGASVTPCDNNLDLSSSLTSLDLSKLSDVNFADFDSGDWEDVPNPESVPKDVPRKTLPGQLRSWAVNRNIPNSTVSALLKILKPFHPTLPKDARTLLKVKPVKGVIPMGSGHYYNFGLSKALRRIVKAVPDLDILEVNIGIDGVPIFKSTGKSAWPILVNVEGAPVPPLMTCVWYGQDKPAITDYLKDFVSEMKELLGGGLVCDGKVHEVTLRKIICDAPAAAYIKAVKGHNAKWGCGRCTQRGLWMGRMTFPSLDAELRTDESLKQMRHLNHHEQGLESPLIEINVGLLSQVPLDPMHLLYLGACRKLLDWFINGCKRVSKKCITDDDIPVIDSRMLAAAKEWPRDFVRKPRALKHIKRFKATEFKYFVHFLAPVVLRGAVPDAEYKLFLLLHVAVTLLSTPDLLTKPDMIDASEGILRMFVRQSRSVLKPQFLVSNIHNLIHLADSCRQWGELKNFWAFPYEDMLGLIKRSVRGKSRPLEQIISRYLERIAEFGVVARAPPPRNGAIVSKRRKRGGQKLDLVGTSCHKVFWAGRKISCLPGDNMVELSSGTVVAISNFVKTTTGTFAVGKPFTRYKSLYKLQLQGEMELDSRDLGICVASNMGQLQRYPLEAVRQKVVSVPMENNTYAIFPFH